MARTCLTIILAAGEGSRMRSRFPKVLHECAGLSLLGHVMLAAGKAGGEAQAVVVGREAETVAEEAKAHSEDVSIYLQKERLGTAHAVLAARQAIERGYDDILVLFGDTPLIKAETLARIRGELGKGAAVSVLGFHTDQPDGYGRLVEKEGNLVAIREHKDASEAELKIRFCNGGIMGLAGDSALDLLDAIGNDNAKGEYYLTDCVAIANERNLQVTAIEAEEEEVHGVNDRLEIARIEGLWQSQRRETLMRNGVTLVAPETVFLSHDTKIGQDTIVEPHVVFGPGVEVAEGAQIRAFSHIEGATIATGCTVGPYARLRPETFLDEGSKVGNFCEVKKAKIGRGAKVNHLTYIGDATVGEHANIGAGTITCNYDGTNKSPTEIGKNAFVGSNSALVAPVKIGDGAIVAAGSAITRDVPNDALAIARGRQENKDGRAVKIREENERKKRARKAVKE